MNHRNQRILTLTVALLVMAVPLTVAVSDDETLEESEGIVPVIVVGYAGWTLVASFIAGAAVGIGGALIWEMNTDTNPSDDETRRVEAQLMAEALMTGIPLYTNAIGNYANIWTLTGEHWVRQAELAAASYWSFGSEYDATSIMDGSRIYYNDAIMMANATNQINAQFELINEHVGKWNDSEVAQYYGDGKMRLQFEFWGNSVSADADDSFTARMGTVVRDVTSDRNAVYYAGGPIYLDGDSPVTISGSKGHEISLNPGWNWIEDPDTFEYADVYELVPGATYFSSSMTSVVTAPEFNSAYPEVAFAVTCGDDSMIVSYDKADGTLTDGSTERSAFDNSGEPVGMKIRILAEGNDAEEQDLTSVLVQYGELQSAISVTQTKANTSAMAVWSIYDDAGSASAYLTTLTVPDTYQNVTFNEAQKRMITVLAMDQLAEYWNAYGGDVKTSDYRMTLDSMSLYCRGSISIPGATGESEKVYDDVIFTPVFYQDETLRSGTSNVVDQQGFIMVWSEGRSLASYDGEYTYENTDLIFIPSGATLGITEMKNAGEMVQSVDLDSAEVDWIDAEDMEDFDPYDPERNDMAQLIRLIFLAIGIGVAAYGVYSRNIVVAVIGVALIVVGVLFADGIANVIDRYLGVRFLWP